MKGPKHSYKYSHFILKKVVYVQYMYIPLVLVYHIPLTM